MAAIELERDGEDLLIRIPAQIAKTIDLLPSDVIEAKAVERGFDIRRACREDERILAQAQARAAAESILRRSKGVRLDGLSIREMIEDGRR